MMKRKHLRTNMLKVLLLFAATIELVFLVEAGLRKNNIAHFGNSYYLWPPYFSRVSTTLPNTFPGISGEKRFFINSMGLRGDEPKSHHDVRILAMGGSTTEGGMLDENETWPQVLQVLLRDVYEDTVWVGNAGRRGSTSRDHVWQIKYFLPQVREMDTLLLLTGINDFMLHLYDSYTPELVDVKTEADTDELNHAFFIHPGVAHGIKGTAIWQTAKRLKWALLGRNKIFDIEGKTQLEWQKKRFNQPKVNQLPDLSHGLEEYSHNLEQIISFTRKQQIRLILLTQPTIWKKNISVVEEKLLWFGCAENKTYTCYAAGTLDEGMKFYNQVVLDVCQREKIECIDLAREIPQDTTVFYDDVHFNVSGAKKVAQVVKGYLTK